MSGVTGGRSRSRFSHEAPAVLILSALSLLLFVAVVVLWMRSYGGMYSVVRTQTTSVMRIDCTRGRFFVSRASRISGGGSGLWTRDVYDGGRAWRVGRAYPPLDLNDERRSEREQWEQIEGGRWLMDEERSRLIEQARPRAGRDAAEGAPPRAPDDGARVC